MSTQAQWKWCTKCQGLFYGPNPPDGVCPAGGAHNATGGVDYAIGLGNTQTSTLQPGFLWCQNCQAMFYGPLQSTSACAASPSHGPHVSTGSGQYEMTVNAPPVQGQGQSQWSWCRNCQGLFFGPNAASSVCPSGGTKQPHNGTGSGNYTLAYTPDNWTQDSLIPTAQNAAGTSGPPALATLGNELYCIREGRGGQGWMWCMTNNGTGWSQDALLPGSENAYGTSGRPGTCVYGNTLYLMHQGRGSGYNGLWIATATLTSSGVQWGADVQLPDSAVSTSRPTTVYTGVYDWPSVNVVPNFLNGETRLVCTFRPGSSTSRSVQHAYGAVIYTSHALTGPFDSGWTDAAVVPGSDFQQSEWTPSATVFGTQFIVFLPIPGGDGPDPLLYELVYDLQTAQWYSGWVVVGSTNYAFANSVPATCVHDGTLSAI